MQLAKVIPDKLFFKIGEVCELVEVQPHVLRYWESEFPMLTPQKNRAGQRTYRRKDVEIVLRIKQLLYDEGFTIAGAKKRLASDLRGGTKLKVVPSEPTIKADLGIKVETNNRVEVTNNKEPIAEIVGLTLQQKRALGKLRQELQALLTILSRDEIISGK